jgi:hypothetical protein
VQPMRFAGAKHVKRRPAAGEWRKQALAGGEISQWVVAKYLRYDEAAVKKSTPKLRPRVPILTTVHQIAAIRPDRRCPGDASHRGSKSNRRRHVADTTSAG